MKSYRALVQRVLPASFLFVAVGISGCDTVVSDEAIVLQEEVSFRFEFSTAGQIGEAIQVDSESTFDLDDLLADEGFTKGDVIRVSARSAVVDLVSPVQENLDAFDRIELTLRGSGLNLPAVGATEEPPGERSAELDIIADGVTEIVTVPAFGGRLTVVPNLEEDFVLQGTIDLRIDVESI